MKSWFFLGPVLLFPFMLLLVLGAIPDLSPYLNAHVGGVYLRAQLLNAIVPYVFSDSLGWAIVDWYRTAGTGGQLSLHTLVAWNINLVLMPFLYIIGQAYIGFSNWSTRTGYDYQRRGVK